MSVEENYLKVIESSRVYSYLKIARYKIYSGLEISIQSKNPFQILENELTLLKFELEKYENNSIQRSSLNTAIEEINNSLLRFKRVLYPEEYKSTYEDYSLSKSRDTKGLPIDEIRQAFVSHKVRLKNLQKSRLSLEEKEIINTRIKGITLADTIYRDLRQDAVPSILNSVH
ncbi:hypothetical protein [Taylorella equigenitalis]|uniref:Endonuclease MutS2 n=2 Tax=Taylorella equigenitalis TaxID=29575 RepID=A0ABM5N958_9BURK|nr:hypothetical protein [Taylorella equigenitalis]AFN35490.1 hypothetical protein KUI_0398 [Taylorella equigenitalis ATCC 35865]ASY40059.1 hypothetical protein CA604_01975 [Taylorella equigenitalis]ASY41500.1 hypothetical protein CAV20_01805 [Taylorella equigenitalis]RBA25939.1 hypothetical protein DQW13_07455 [Taylorella equigenitalis]WDU48221.1 hypothetical protein KNO30_01835 [Taylorella equigenitalis]